MPHNFVPLLALILLIASGIYLASGGKPSLGVMESDLPPCADQRQMDDVMRAAATGPLRDFGEGGNGLFGRSTLHVSDEGYLTQGGAVRRCSGMLNVVQPKGRKPALYAVAYDIGWHPRQDDQPVVAIVSLEPRPLPGCNDGATASFMRDLIAWYARGDAEAGEDDDLTPGTNLTDLREVSYEEAEETRHCRGKVTLLHGGKAVYDDRPFLFTIAWGTRELGEAMIDFAGFE
ncbi:hypothetical protein sos41_33730 [Alphaproteobacteria bacterium SO-S41]|nr:hypothetical protein sos41_33730 [Alphaproteobacteria bacterium SO-S41]